MFPKMKQILIIALAVMSVLFVSCDLKYSEPADFKILSTVGEDGMVEFIVTTSNQDITYIIGLVDDVNMADMGGKDGIREYVIESLASNTFGSVYTGSSVYTYTNLTKYVYWYFYVAQIHEGRLVGDLIYSAPTRIFSPYLEYRYPSAWSTANAVSDNGLWVVGAANGNEAFLYDVVKESGQNLTGGALSCVTNEGVCYGQDVVMQLPVKYENGKFTAIMLPGNRQGDAMAVTADGSKFYGWCSASGRMFVPYVVDNGEFKELSMEGSTGISYLDPDTKDTVHCGMMAARVGTCANNGAAAGYAIASGPDPGFEQGVIWKADGAFKVIGERKMFYDLNSGVVDYMFGGYHTAISPDGKYAASHFSVSGFDVFSESSGVYLYDIETDEIILPSEDDMIDMAGLSVCCVANDGTIYLTGAGEPYMWRQDLGVWSLHLYLESIYGPFQPKMTGRLVDVSANGKTFVLCQGMEDALEGAYTVTKIFNF